MSLLEENLMLYVLHRNEVSREHIARIMKDLRKSCVFQDSYVEEDEDEWNFLEEQAHLIFDKDMPKNEKITAIRETKKRQAKLKTSQFSQDREKRIREKINSLISEGVLKEESNVCSDEVVNITTRYGRSPLHEAVAIKDINLVAKYIEQGLYLECIDHSGHTAMEMAYYDGYKEALALFENVKQIL